MIDAWDYSTTLMHSLRLLLYTTRMLCLLFQCWSAIQAHLTPHFPLIKLWWLTLEWDLTLILFLKNIHMFFIYTLHSCRLLCFHKLDWYSPLLLPHLCFHVMDASKTTLQFILIDVAPSLIRKTHSLYLALAFSLSITILVSWSSAFLFHEALLFLGGLAHNYLMPLPSWSPLCSP